MSAEMDDLQALIDSYEDAARIYDGSAQRLVDEAEREGWHDDTTQQIDWFRHQAATVRALAQEVRDGMGE